MKGHYRYTSVIFDSEDNAYSTSKYLLCELCKEILLQSEAKKVKHILFNDMNLLICNECYADGTMIKRSE